MASMFAKQSSVLIVGAGTFGLATALELAKSGYTSITVLEKDDQIPSRFSAGYDINKIVRAEYHDPFYVEMAAKAIKEWKTPLYAPHYHQTGILHTTSPAAPKKARETLQTWRDSISGHPDFKDSLVPVTSPEQIKKLVWQFKDGSMEGWTGYLNRQGGYAHAANAMRAVYEECVRKGVRFIIGDADGQVQTLKFEEEGAHKRCIGVESVSGRQYTADMIILALGANASSILPQLSRKVEARSWSLAHIKLTPDEVSALRGIPVTYPRDLGFFVEPDPITHLLKICPMGSGFTNYSARDRTSLPPQRRGDFAFIPEEDEARIRHFLRETLPALADRPLVDTRLCWFADNRRDAFSFIIDYVPNTSNSLVVLSGDSGHGFKMFPVFGRYVRALLENGGKPQQERRWAWGEVESQEAGSIDVEWRVGKSKQFKELKRSRL